MYHGKRERLTTLKGLKTLEVFLSGREYYHVKYVKYRERQRHYLIMLKKLNPGIKMT